MSEYQYYEFQAVERPLTPAQIGSLRKISSRAKITPTQFQNVYSYGDFRGEPLDLMQRYFDAFVYVANWGTNQFMVRLPDELVDLEAARAYEVEGALTIHSKGDVIILDFDSHEEEGWGWITDEEAQSWMPELLPLRAELASGDLRALYIAWLSAARGGVAAGDGEDEEDFADEDDYDGNGDDGIGPELSSNTREPPVPPGLGRLSKPLKVLASFLRVDENLIAVAAERSADLPPEPPPAELQPWIADLPAAAKDDLLGQLAANPARAQTELMRRFREATVPQPVMTAGERTVAELLAAADRHAEERRRREAAREAAARATFLDSLVGQEEALWRQVYALIEAKQGREYDEAVKLLKDLHDLSVHKEQEAAFLARLRPLRAEHARRPALLKRFAEAGLPA